MYFQAFALPQTSKYAAGCLVLGLGDAKMEVGGAPISSRKVLQTRPITRTGTISVTNGFEPYCTLQIQQRHSGHVMRLNINSAKGERKPGGGAVAPWFCRLQQTWWDSALHGSNSHDPLLYSVNPNCIFIGLLHKYHQGNAAILIILENLIAILEVKKCI